MDKVEVVIATDNCERMLYVIAKNAINTDCIELSYVDKYAPTTEYLLRLLRKAFGWMVVDRGKKEVKNARCKYNISNMCATSKVKCNETIRVNCNKYEQLYNNLIQVNTVTIEKAGGIRGID